MIEPGVAPTQQQLRELLAVMTPEDLHKLLRAANENYAYEGEFARRVVTLDAQARTAAWSSLDFARRVCAHEIPAMVNSRWFTPTPEILHWLHRIDMLACGRMVTALERLGDEQQRFASQSLMNEAIAVCLTPDESRHHEDVRSFLRQGVEPRTRTERLVVNFYSTMREVPKLASSPLEMDAVLEVQNMLARGLCEGNECTAFRRKNIPRKATVDRWPGAYTPPLAHEVESALEHTLAAANRQDPWTHPLIHGLMLYFSLLNLRPFEIGDVGLARALFQIHMHRSGYPALQLMPISQILLHRYAEYARLWPADNNGDLTGFVTWAVESVWHALETLARSIDARVAENDRLRAQLRFDPSLNHRQRTILGRAIRLPGATFFIDYHRRSYDIAYSTARADLIGLVDRGYMRVRRDGHAFVFTAAPGLRRLVTEKSVKPKA
ncbi:MAG: Fic family protein [Coriobacteriia bacterium]